ncbi:MAG: beta-N-acetylhexosaminidase [Candidatus Binatia bacterium]
MTSLIPEFLNARVSMLTLRQKIGQMLMVGVSGLDLSRQERTLFRDYPFGGFILFKNNCSEPAQILSLCRSLWEAGKNQPPFIAIDQEGGRVHRLPQPFTHFPAAALLGRKGDPDLALRAGRAAAAELSLLGVNLDFAPVLDVDSNPNNPIIGDRSFGSTPDRVVKIASAWIRGLRAGGIIPCGKHFPGHGDTEKDSHFCLPVVEKSVETLRALELTPFVHACRERIESLMTAHVLFRSLDRDYPATLSHKIVTGILRRELGYGGVVFGDDMEMKAVTDNYGTAEAVALGIGAGVDVFMYCHDQSAAVSAFDFVVREAEKDRRLAARVEESYNRIQGLKAHYLLSFTGAGEEELNGRVAQLDHQRIVDEIQGSL